MQEPFEKLSFHVSETLDPYANLAVEEALAWAVQPGEWTLFLWRNDRTVVVGRNQNAWKECAVEVLEADGGKVARRRSGGGAVYHDAGNVNFTFIARQGAHDVARNLAVICRAVRSFGLNAQVSGRNDVLVDGAKFSGNAFFSVVPARVHHGTLMIGVDTDALARYLRPDPRKLQAKGVDSVRSRVGNLGTMNAAITVESLCAALEDAFADVGGRPVERFDLARLDEEALAEAQARFASWEWRLGAVRPFTDNFDARFAWGLVEFGLSVERGTVKAATVHSDALDADFIEQLEASLAGVRYRADEVAAALEAVPCADDGQETMRRDCANLARAALSGLEG